MRRIVRRLLARQNRHFDIANLLVDRGASVSIDDSMGSTPIDLAIAHGKRAADFIQNDMDNLILNISRRRPLLALTPDLSANLTVAATRKAITGSWAGYYEYFSWHQNKQGPFSIDIPAETPHGSQPSAFFHENEDAVGHFQFRDFVDAVSKVWSVKLYDELGWLYHGKVGPEKDTLKETWGRNRKLWFFLLQKE
ncbi:ankyrin repeat and SOCS box protein 7 [Colletotrichum tofieldiae]|uniref:Ankyrin repeat and SOCS box protein 7 n=1 Tax=Colletotrichum tofieldiae TaxID=708197 RepID=A0A166RJ51_9PEZI|nr:ankyrin repeat and SOCS box protein 7 [Colletotrichum tofieldiae]